jgi:hypothetical protein
MKPDYLRVLPLMLPVLMLAMACDDDDDLPNVSVGATIAGGVIVGNEMVVSQGDTIVVDSIYLINYTKNEGDLGVVSYYWDHMPVGSVSMPPYKLRIPTSNQALGFHRLQAKMPIYVVDYPICWGSISYLVNIIPGDDGYIQPGN